MAGVLHCETIQLPERVTERGRTMRLRSALALGLVTRARPRRASGSGEQAGQAERRERRRTSPSSARPGTTARSRPSARRSSRTSPSRDDYAYQGTWNGGFRIVDISRPWRPKPVAEVDCGTFQGDIGVYGDLVFRSIDTPVAADDPGGDVRRAARGAPASRASRSSRWTSRGAPSADDLVAAVADRLRLAHAHGRARPEERPRAPLRLGERDRRPTYDNDPVWRHECSAEHDKFQIVVGAARTRPRTPR